MKVTWEVSDGYAGGARPHTTVIDDEDLEACTTDDEREDLIHDTVQDDFEREISWREIRRED